MDRPDRRKLALAGFAASIVVAAALSALLRRAPERREAALGMAPPEPPPAPADAPKEIPPDERGYVRRLKVVEPPAPGQPPRDVRDAAVVQEETAVEPKSAYARPDFNAIQPHIESGGSSASASLDGPPPPAGSPPAPGRAPGKRDGKNPPPPKAEDLSALSSASSDASRLVAHARGRLREAAAASGADAGGPVTPAVMAAAIRGQIEKDRRTDDAVRAAISGLGPGAPPDAQRAAAAAALSAAGEPATPEAVDEAVARASAPAPQTPPPAAVEAAIQRVAANPMTEPAVAELADIILKEDKQAMKPSAPPPRGGVQAYAQYRDAFDKTEKDFGLAPAKIVPFPAIESSFGANTGKYKLTEVLQTIQRSPKFSAAQQRQASHDMAAVAMLDAAGELGGHPVSEIKSSNMGAIGITQFLPSSWQTWGRAYAPGKKKDPWDFRDAVYSTGNFLDKHGARNSYERSILSYNHSDKYQHDILQYGANVAPGIQAVRDGAIRTPQAPSKP